MTERVAIVGSREHPATRIVHDYCRGLPEGTVVISGGARGVDTAARNGWRAWGLVREHRIVPVRDTAWHELREFRDGRGAPHQVRFEWTPYSVRSALLYRNTLIALDCTRMVVFPDGSKGGCWDTARQALRFRRPCEVRWASGRVEPFTGKRS